MTLTVGTRLGPYEIVALLGAGGMGEVYRARDTTLDRDVALKVLPDSLSNDPDRLMRFTREAKALAALNHPNVAAIHGIEESGSTRSLVMELVEGEDLSAIIAAGAKAPALHGSGIPLADALPIARQLAEALEAAHDAGIIHRDLKPANIKVRPDGTVKVLDFGLAKALDPSAATPYVVSESPTMTSPTDMGMILGTAAYMAPEQARGRAVDRRADIWSFGAVLFEMLTGTRAFGGHGAVETLSAVIGNEPDWSLMPSATPARVRELLRRCLTKDSRQRLQSIAEARITLERAIAQADEPAATGTTPHRQASGLGRALPWAIALVMAAAAAATWVGRHPPPASAPLVRLNAQFSPDAAVVPFVGPAMAFSPDGTLLAFRGTAKPDDTPMIFVRRLDQLAAQPLSGTEGVTDIFFSPDGQWLAFFTEPGRELKKVLVTGGSVATICDVANARGGDWLDNNRIVLAASSRAALSAVSAAGGALEPLTQLDAAAGEITHRFPQVLPGGKAVLYTAHANSLNFDDANVYAQPLQNGGVRKLVLRGGYLARYVASGHLMYVHEGSLFAVAFDLDRLETVGKAVPVVADIATVAGSAGAQYAVSPTGTLAYLPPDGTAGVLEVAWLERGGRATPIRESGNYRALRISPDGHRIALEVSENGRSDIWLYEWQREILTRLTLHRASEEKPLWSPDGRRVVFASDQDTPGSPSLFWKRIDDEGRPQALLSGRYSEFMTASTWAPGGRGLVFGALDPNQETGYDLLRVPIDGDEVSGWRPGAVTPVLNAPINEDHPAFSPDGRWLAYTSTESRRSEVFVRRFPELDRKQQVSIEGGRLPTWSRSGRELFYEDLSLRIMVVNIDDAGGDLRLGKPALWADLGLATLEGRNFDVHPDGKRLAVLRVPPSNSATSRRHVVLVFNAFEEVRRLLSTSTGTGR